jgi:hypothetical protein
MTRLALALVLTAVASLATPAAAQSLSILLPAISFPEPVTTPSTKDCAPDAPVCQNQE